MKDFFNILFQWYIYNILPLIVCKRVNLTVETSKLSFKSKSMRKLTIRSVFPPFFVNSKLYAKNFYAKFFDLNEYFLEENEKKI